MRSNGYQHAIHGCPPHDFAWKKLWPDEHCSCPVGRCSEKQSPCSPRGFDVAPPRGRPATKTLSPEGRARVHALTRGLAALRIPRDDDVVLEGLDENFVFVSFHIDVADAVLGEATCGDVSLSGSFDAHVGGCWHCHAPCRSMLIWLSYPVSCRIQLVLRNCANLPSQSLIFANNMIYR